MNTVRKEVRDLISVHERLQSALSLGESFTETERGIIRMCTTELLASIASKHIMKPGDGNEAVALGRLSDVFNGQGHIAVHGEADGGLVAEKLSKH